MLLAVLGYGNDGWTQAMTQAGWALPSSGGTSFESLRRPLLGDEQHGVGTEHDARANVARLLEMLADEIGHRAVEQVAQQLIWTMMLESMNARMMDAEAGPVPRFLSQLERAARSFDRHIR